MGLLQLFVQFIPVTFFHEILSILVIGAFLQNSVEAKRFYVVFIGLRFKLHPENAVIPLFSPLELIVLSSP